MGKTIFHDLYALSRKISMYLPMGDNLPLDKEVSTHINNIPYKPVEGEHWSVVSKTGNGKTTFDKSLIRGYLRKYPWLNVYILDSKKLGDFSERDGKVWNTYDPPPLLTGIGQKQVWQPVTDDIDMYDRYFTRILQAGKPCIVLIDESKNLKFNTRVPKGYELLLSQGRLPGIFTITNSQEVANGLRQAFSQPTHLVCFSVWNAYDERIMKSYLRLPTDQPMPLNGKHSFMYINRDKMGKAISFKDYHSFIDYFMEW